MTTRGLGNIALNEVKEVILDVKFHTDTMKDAVLFGILCSLVHVDVSN